MTNDAVTKGGALVGVQTMTCQLAMGHLTDCMNKVAMVKVLKPVLIWIMGIGLAIEVMCRGILNTIFITGILRGGQNTWDDNNKRAYSVFLFIEHEGGNSVTGVGTIASLTMDTNGGPTNAEVVDGARDGTRRRRHDSDG